jgi:glycosyltransferase involved in cell wall biosynthesis
MKIGIDLRQLILEASGGISQHLKGICEHMFALHPDHRFLVFCTPFNRSLLDYEAEHVRYFSLPIATYFQDLDRIATEERLHVLFRAYPMEDSLHFPLRKQIFFIPDNQHETYPEFFTPEILRTRRVAFANALNEAGAIGTNSEFSRKALLDFPETRCKDVFLMGPSLQVVHGLTKGEEELSDSERALIPQSDYFLFPANLWKHKNHPRLLQAFRLLKEKTGRDISLILTGHPDGWPELSREFSDLPVTHLGFIRPELLRVLLERARALVFFSLYEGFGIPLLEAFDAGTPVVCSNTTSLPEVGGDAVLTCDPTDIEAMAALMERILVDDELREILAQRGKNRLNAYSWEKSAHNLMAACERVMAATTDLSETHTGLREPLPLVSIVTPSYNQGRFIRRTIESVLTQSYPKIEYVVIDGGSNDETVEILRTYDNRFDWVSEPDRGQTDAINKGMARVKGEILAYLNSDDVLAPGAIERVVRFFQQCPDCDMVYGDADYIDEEDRVTGHYKTADYSFNRLIEDCMVCQPAAFWRRRIAEKVGPFDKQLNYAMDYDYWLRIAKTGGDIRFLPEKLACSRLYPETKTQSARSEIYREIFEICRRHVGYVHQSYYRGYWHHRIYDNNNVISRIFRLHPGLYTKLGWLHRKWNHRNKYPLGHIASFFLRKAIRRFKFLQAISHWKATALRKLFAPANSLARSNTSIVGFLSDNWIEPTLTVAPKKRASGQILHLAGIAPVDLIMSVRAGGKEIHKFTFNKNQYEKASFPADLIGNERIDIQFSGFVKDNAKRRLAFLLQDTNIFSEQDTW